MLLVSSYNYNDQLTENFTYGEILDASTPDKGWDSVYMDFNVIDIAQYIRTAIDQPITVSSAYRNLEHNRAIGSNDASQHPKSRALDLNNDDVTLWIIQQKLKNTEHWVKLKQMGLRGLGLYDWGIHIDTRQSADFAFWDFRKKKVKTIVQGIGFTWILIILTILWKLKKKGLTKH